MSGVRKSKLQHGAAAISDAPSLVLAEGRAHAVIRNVAIVGAGWAGCAAGIELARRGCRVTLFEAARTPGGRARRVEIDGKVLDNGQHILLGAYTETLRLMKAAGIDTDRVLLRLPLQMRYPKNSGGMDFITPRLPAPFHLLVALLRAKGLRGEDKLGLARFSTTARWMDWRLDVDCSVTELLHRLDQTERLIKLMWRPLCIAALNTPPERASARVFLSVLGDSLGARSKASDMLIPRVDLTAVFPQHAAAFIERHGGSVKCGTAVKTIERDGERWRIGMGDTSSDEPVFDAVVVATQLHHAANMLGELIDIEGLASFTHEPITTCYLQYSPEVKLQQPFFALIDNPATGEWGQFVFDRGQLDRNQAGLLAVVVSASTDAIALGHDALSAAIAVQLAQAFQSPELAYPQWTKVISEKRATFSCIPNLVRPDNATKLQGLALAGDYTACEYPATLEAAVRSGVKAAQHLFP